MHKIKDVAIVHVAIVRHTHAYTDFMSICMWQKKSLVSLQYIMECGPVSSGNGCCGGICVVAAQILTTCAVTEQCLLYSTTHNAVMCAD